MASNSSNEPAILQKCPSGIEGLDEITCGGLPLGRASLVCGSAGCGKTMLSMQFLVNGALQYNEPGVFVSFEETEAELIQNFASLGIDLDDLCSKKKIMMDYVYIDKDQIEETGDYDLEGLFLRLDYAINSIGAKRVVLDTIEALFSGLSNTKILRAELRRLFRWLKDKGVTSIITGEQGSGTLTRHGIEEYVSDCVILLDHKVFKQISTRRVRIVKYRGSAHGTNEYPFLIDEQGISIMPITSIGLKSEALNSRVSTGIPRLNTMLGGEGFYVGSTVLISGTAGTGKTSVAAHIVDAACHRGERCLYFAFEESQSQIIRNMRSIGVDLDQWISENLLRLYAWRPTNIGLEMHLLSMHKKIAEYTPAIVVIDPITNLTEIANETDVKVMLMRLMDFLKMKNITTILLDLSDTTKLEATGVGISSLVDTWITLRDMELNGERNRGLHIIKSRGMAHSNQIREFVLTDKGILLNEERI
ncbi:Circadian clock protein kinase KaiC [Sporomusa ovata DSM 2662]|uniref:non-specific serine/threonine protein kinase n=1 Tax=Sporomusa ovata TaxID=2378 RepID=A0A0U1L5H2_9FIRM|nr:circadian clock protein KaiC [Sporomusa ovata]EQB28604.1 KaiC-like protein 1 [Sporomusa ovata DSM 2662]CQR74936.1 Circadian clock protein KaiC [Sporomusa ovata]